MKHLLAITLIATAALLVLGPGVGRAGASVSDAENRVIDDRVPVYPRMAVSGGAIHELNKGDEVVVQFEMEKSSRSWCSIVHKGETTISGYVECRHLEQKHKAKWELIDRTGNTAPSSSYMGSTSVRVIGNQVLVPVALNFKGVEVPVQMLLDTGASSSAVKGEVARRLGVDLDHAINVKAMVVGGGSIDVKVVQLSRMTVGPHQVPDPVIGVFEHTGAPVHFDGILGMDFLRTVDYQVDLDRGIITWGR